MASVNLATNQTNLKNYKNNQWNDLARSSNLTQYQPYFINNQYNQLYAPETIDALSKIIPNVSNSISEFHGVRGANGVPGAIGVQGAKVKGTGAKPTHTYGKDMYISLDVHDGTKESQQVINAVRTFPKINFTLYFYERDKERIPGFLEKLPNVGIGLHIGPSGTLEEVERFYKYIKNNKIQPLESTPASIHGEAHGRLSSKVMNKLDEYNAPFVRTADSNGPVSGKLRNVIPARWANYKNFPEDLVMQKRGHYFTHANELTHDHSNQLDSTKIQYKILNYFNQGVGQ